MSEERILNRNENYYRDNNLCDRYDSESDNEFWNFPKKSRLCDESCLTVVHLHNYFFRNEASAHLPSLAVVATTALRVSEEWLNAGLYLEPHENWVQILVKMPSST